ncbi:Mfa1 family fimbria major subunit [Phocaeicola sp.]
MKSNKVLLSFLLAAAMAGCVNDADVVDGGGINPVDDGNVKISFVVPNSSNGSRAATAEDSGIYEQGAQDEYKITNVRLYLYDATSKNFVESFLIESGDLTNTSTVVPGQGTDQTAATIVYNCTKNITVKPGTYDIFAVANSTGYFGEGNEDALLASVDASTYNAGKIGKIPNEGFIMSNRGSANLGKIVVAPETANTKTEVNINLERAVAKLMLRNKEKSDYELKDPSGATYATVALNNYRYVNLSTQFYTFRHVATLADADETPGAPTYTVGTNFGAIPATNGYAIDPYFFNKTKAGAEGFSNPANYYAQALKDQANNNNWDGTMAPTGEYTSVYCLENCMFRAAQYTPYTTGIMLRGTFAPTDGRTFNALGEKVNYSTFDELYYFNYNFYTSLEAVKEVGKANLPANANPSDKELEEYQILHFYKNTNGGFNTYYNYWIKHLDNDNPTYMGVMEFGIVRNNIYSVNITSIKNLGPGKPNTDPDPDEYKAYLDVTFGVYPWIVRDQDADLEN